MREWTCERCGTALFSDDYVMDGKVFCQECYEFGERTSSILDFIRSYPDRFIEYLQEGYNADEDMTISILKDYKEWNEIEFYEWVMT